VIFAKKGVRGKQWSEAFLKAKKGKELLGALSGGGGATGGS